MFKGSLTALITPFKGGKVDDGAFQRLVEWQIAEGTHGLVPVGTTGESPTLSHEEHKQVVELCVKTARKRVPVIAGAGSNSTAEAIDFTRHAKQVGADAVLHSTGYYNKPTQDGLYRHFKAISDAVDIPIFLYNVPVRTILDIQVATMARCAELENVVGVGMPPPTSRAHAKRLACGKDVQLSARTPRCLASWRTVAMAASRSLPMWPRACAPTSRTPASRATTRRRWSCRTN
jgi:4-hydroxy-tetrahydrodipicolinate synthase